MYYVSMAKKRSIVAERIEELLRIKAPMSVADLSRASGVTESAISNILSGKRERPRSDTIQKLALGFPTSTDYLNGKTNDPDPVDAPPLPDWAAEVVASMRKLDLTQNYQIYLIAQGFVREQEEIRRMGRQDLIELLLDYADALGSPEETNQAMELLQRLDQKFYGSGGSPRQLTTSEPSDPGEQAP